MIFQARIDEIGTHFRRIAKKPSTIFLCACFLLTSGFEAAAESNAVANSNQQAIELARKLGRELSAEGLQAIIEARNVDLLDAYRRNIAAGLQERRAKGGTGKVLPSDVEALITTHYADPELGTILRSFYANGDARYQTLELFNAMYAEWRSGQGRPPLGDLRNAIIATDLAGIEAPLMALLNDRKFAERNDGRAVIGFLALRKYLPAVAVISDLAKDAKTNGDLARLAGDSLVKIGGAQADAAVLQRLKWLRDQPTDIGTPMEIEHLMEGISRRAGPLPWEIAVYRKALPVELGRQMKLRLIETIARNSDANAVPELLRLLIDPEVFSNAFEVLVKSESPEVWAATRRETDLLAQQKKLTDQQYRYAIERLDRMLADPSKWAAAKRLQEREGEFDSRQAAMRPAPPKLTELKSTAPDEYVIAQTAFLNSQAVFAAEFSGLGRGIALMQSLDGEYFNLAGFVRFRLGNPAKALELYEQGAKVGTQAISRIGLADTYQFDLSDRHRAIDTLVPMLPAEPGRVGDGEAAMLQNLYGTWVRAQIDYLKTGKTFGGTMTGDDLSRCGTITVVGGWSLMAGDVFALAPIYARLAESADIGIGVSLNPALRSEITKKLSVLPTSAFALISSFGLLGALPDADAILRHVNRNDPSGYLGACLFSTLTLLDGRLRQNLERDGRRAGTDGMVMVPGIGLLPVTPDHPMSVAAARFLKERKIDLRLANQPGAISDRNPTRSLLK